jgi:hypothetical protein
MLEVHEEYIQAFVQRNCDNELKFQKKVSVLTGENIWIHLKNKLKNIPDSISLESIFPRGVS